MSTNQPVIKFSPFEALLIGEKNNILKRQPTTNTIFVRRVNQPSKTINLRDLFGLENNTKKSDNNEVVFKMPQRVRDFLKIRRLKNKNIKSLTDKKPDVLCYEFEGQEMIFKNNEIVKPKKAKIKSNKVKFKNFNKENLVKKFNSQNKMKSSYYGRFKNVYPKIVLKSEKQINYGNRHLLRGKDGKFISKKEYEMLYLNGVSQKDKSLNQLYLKNSKKTVQSDNEKKSNDLKVSNLIENILELPNFQSDLNEILENYDLKDFKLPSFLKALEPADFDDDSYLCSLIYENFPKIAKFDCNNKFEDFSDALKEAKIIKVDRSLKMYDKKPSIRDSDVRVVFNNRIPHIQLKNNFHSGYRSLKNGYKSDIDEPFNKNNHLITCKSIGSLFFGSMEKEEIFLGDLVKPYFQNSWFAKTWNPYKMAANENNFHSKSVLFLTKYITQDNFHHKKVYLKDYF